MTFVQRAEKSDGDNFIHGVHINIPNTCLSCRYSTFLFKFKRIKDEFCQFEYNKKIQFYLIYIQGLESFRNSFYYIVIQTLGSSQQPSLKFICVGSFDWAKIVCVWCRYQLFGMIGGYAWSIGHVITDFSLHCTLPQFTSPFYSCRNLASLCESSSQ